MEPPTWTSPSPRCCRSLIVTVPLTKLEKHLRHSNLNKLILGLAPSAHLGALLVVLEPNTAELATKMDEYVSFITLPVACCSTSSAASTSPATPRTPASNTIFLGFGTLFASVDGTTGASMLLIRLVLRANAERKWSTVFFIFLTSECLLAVAAGVTRRSWATRRACRSCGPSIRGRRWPPSPGCCW
ncbi:MAG: sodium:proton antiporter [Nannocystaceae bacterium]